MATKNEPKKPKPAGPEKEPKSEMDTWLEEAVEILKDSGTVDQDEKESVVL